LLGHDSCGRRRVLIGLSGLAAAGVACRKNATPQGAKPRIALVMKSLANEFFLTMETGARAHQAKDPARYELLAGGIKDEVDVSAQATLVEQMLAQKVDAIVLAPADSKALVAACKRAVESGVVVVNIDNRLDAQTLAARGLKIPFVGPDNRKGARAVAEYLAKKLRKGDAVAIIEGLPTTFNAQQRKLGFQDAIEAAQLDLVASQSGDWEMAKANEVAAALLLAHPHLKALLCANDNMALGAVTARKAAGKETAVSIAGFDNIRAVSDLVKSGKVVATADQRADQLAVFGIEYALEALTTKASPADRETPVDLVTAESLRT
jgi:ribose transport system substrate-binding protein